MSDKTPQPPAPSGVAAGGLYGPPCQTCKGRGQVESKNAKGVSRPVPCPACKGRGTGWGTK